MRPLGRSWAYWLLFLLLPAWFLAPVLSGRAIGQGIGFEIAADRWGSEPFDVLHADADLQVRPWRQLVLESWGEGRPAFWNPHQLLGAPFLANSQSAVFYPPHVVLGMMRVSPDASLNLLAWLHISLLGLGAAALARRLGAEGHGPVVAGGTVALAGFVGMWSPFASVLGSVAWMPWVWAAMVPADDEPHWRRAGAGALATAMMMLAGHLQFAAFGVMGAMVLALGLAVVERRVAWVAVSAVTVLLGALAAMPQVLPVLEGTKTSHRRTVATAEGFAAYQNSAVKLFELPSLVSPMLLGQTRTRAELTPPDTTSIAVRIPPLSTYWPQYAKPGAHPAESALGVGPLALVLLALGFRHWTRRAKVAVISLGLLGLLIALGTPFNALLYYGLPGWSGSGSPGRAAILWVIAAGLGAGLSWASVTESKATKTPLYVLLGVGLGGVAIANWMATTQAPWLPNVAMFFDQIQAQALVNALPFVVGALACAAAALLVPDARGKVAAALISVALATGPGWVPTHTPEPSHVELATGNGRVVAVNRGWNLLAWPQRAVLMPNLAMRYGMYDAFGYDSLIPATTVEALTKINGGTNPAPPTNGNMMLLGQTDPAELAEAGVSVVFAPEGPQEVAGRPLAEVNGEAVTMRSDAQGLTLDTQGKSGLVVARFIPLPGWQAFADGKPVPLQDNRWLAAEVPAGTQTVRFQYTPPGYGPGVMLGLVGILGIAALAVVGARQRMDPKSSKIKYE
ncbi:MAG: hypothetical protein Fur0036_18930 [Fimbriimonadaceae bacterium]